MGFRAILHASFSEVLCGGILIVETHGHGLGLNSRATSLPLNPCYGLHVIETCLRLVLSVHMLGSDTLKGGAQWECLGQSRECPWKGG